jgi:uncharacterized protein
MGSQHIYIKELDKKIIRFLLKHHVMTLATSNDNKPYCCSCFYVYNEKKNEFLVTSASDTRHISEVNQQPYVSGAITLETTMVGKIQGVQFTGTMTELKNDAFNKAKTAYIKRFPVAAFSQLQLWSIFPDFIKFTDNRLGIGKKMIWQQYS